MKRIKLTRGYYTKVDNEDFEYLNQYHWTALVNKNDTVYAVRNKMRMHRLILGLNNPKIFTDHIDHDGLNNQRNNLRICTRLQNSHNRKSAKNSTSKYCGVSILTIRHPKKDYKYWHAQIKYNDNSIHLGNFKSEIRAAIARDKAAIIYHGEFANLNILKIRK